MKFCDEGENQILDVYLKGAASPTLYMGLYKDATEPAESDTVSDITEESGAGYARIQLTQGNWTLVDDTITQPQKTFTATADWGNISGYFLTDTVSGTGGKLVAVENFADGPYNTLSGGNTKITPRIMAA